MNPESYQQLDRIIHERGRLGILSQLAAVQEISFKNLRDTLGMTDGNLSVHLRTLQQAGYVALNKTQVKNRPLTTCSLTEAGRRAFTEYIDVLEKIVRQNKPDGSES